MGLAKEFKEFAMKGNVVDMAVGVIIGTAFGKIVSSLVGDVVMPILGMAIGGMNFADKVLTLGTNPAGQPVVVKYGVFVQSIFDFVVIALAIFLAIRGLNRLKAPPPPPAAPATPEDVLLLREIRDSLKSR
jgi:large conductance mechanosensitive channel